MLKISRESEINLVNVLIDNDIISGKDLINIKKVSSENNKSQIESIFELKLTDEKKIIDLLIKEQNLEKLSLILILSGAVGNLGERGWNLITGNDGKVTDFVEFLFIPSFNLADTYISIGIVLLLYSEIKKD